MFRPEDYVNAWLDSARAEHATSGRRVRRIEEDRRSREREALKARRQAAKSCREEASETAEKEASKAAEKEASKAAEKEALKSRHGGCSGSREREPLSESVESATRQDWNACKYSYHACMYVA